MEIPPPPELKNPLIVPYKLLMGPGPSNAAPRTLQALSQPVLGHMQPELFKIMDEIKKGIQYMFQTKNELTLAVSASGHAAMEAVLCNLLEPGDVVLILANGLWGERAVNMAERHGAVVKKLIKSDISSNFSIIEIENAVKNLQPKMLFVVQGESSTGIYQPLEGLGEVTRRYNCLLAVDTVASLGAVPLLMDAWKIDAVYTASQKILGVPPGLSPISFSPKAQYHHTTSANLLYALREGLAVIAEEGLEKVMKRHQDCAALLYKGIQQLGLEFYVEEEHKRLPSVTTIKVPTNVNWIDVVEYAMKNYQLQISGGLGPTVGKVFRIGIMGYNATPEKINFTLQVLEEALEYSKNNSKL